jgi:hypothetical protein
MIFSVANELFDFMCWYYFFENVPASMSSSWDFGSIDKQGWWVEPDYLGTTAEPTFNTKLPAVPLDFIRAPSTGWPHPGPVDANIGIARRRLRDFLVRLIVPNAVTSMISFIGKVPTWPPDGTIKGKVVQMTPVMPYKNPMDPPPVVKSFL